MKKLRSVVAFLLCFVLIIANFTQTHAAEAVPAYDHCATCDLCFYIEDGLAYVYVDYNANNTTFTYMQSSVKIQKRFLGIFWSTVDIGLEDNLWVETSTEDSTLLRATFPIEDLGTYRAVFDIDFYGTTDVVDEIDHTIEWTYNE